MTIDNTIIQKLAAQYFSGQMPEDLHNYLLDTYGEEPLHGDLSPQFFWPAVRSDIQNYLNGCLDTAVRSDLQKLRDHYKELSDIVSEFAEGNRLLEVENRYLHDFITWMKLEEKYLEFKEHSHEEKDEYGLTRLVM